MKMPIYRFLTCPPVRSSDGVAVLVTFIWIHQSKAQVHDFNFGTCVHQSF